MGGIIVESVVYNVDRTFRQPDAGEIRSNLIQSWLCGPISRSVRAGWL